MGGTEGKLQGKIGCDMQGTAKVYLAFDVQHNGTPCFSISIPEHWHFISAKEIHGKQNQEQKMEENNVNMLKIQTWNRKDLWMDV